MLSIMKTLLLPFKPWTISALCSILYVKGMILLSGIVRQHYFNSFMDVDYLTHGRFGSPFTRLDNLDSLVLCGVHPIFWWLAAILTIRNAPVRQPHPKWTHKVSAICSSISAGLILFYLVLVKTMFSLADFEGYHPLVDSIYRTNHGPWHEISHLGFLVFYELLIIAGSVVLAVCGLVLRFNRQTIFICLLSTALLFFHAKELLWLID